MYAKRLAGMSLVFSTAAASAQTSSACAAYSQRMLEALHGLMDSAGIPGASIAIIDRGRLARAEGLGYADSSRRTKVDRNTVFEAASLSKPVIAYATLKLVDIGR